MHVIRIIYGVRMTGGELRDEHRRLHRHVSLVHARRGVGRSTSRSWPRTRWRSLPAAGGAG